MVPQLSLRLALVLSFGITSPPYWNLKDYGDSDEEIGSGGYEKYLAELRRVWAECYKKGSDDAILVVNINSRRVKGKFYPIAMDIASSMEEWDLWDHNI